MLIIAGSLFLRSEDRDAYLSAVAGVTTQARLAPGCLDFVQSPDPLDGTRIVIFERWESAELLAAYRSSGSDDEELDTPELTGADVRRYEISAVSDP